MTLTKKRFVLKNKKGKTNRKKYRKTYKKNLKKHKKTYKRLRKKRIGGVNINTLHPESPQNIRILANFTNGGVQDITGGLVEIFEQMQFNDDGPPPNFSQLQAAMEKGLLSSSILDQNQIDRLKIKVFANSNNKLKLVYATNGKNGDNLLEANTEYLIIPDENEDRIAAAITDPSTGTAFGIWRALLERSYSNRGDSAAMISRDLRNSLHGLI